MAVDLKMPGSLVRKQRSSMIVVVAGQLLLLAMVFSLSVQAHEEPSVSEGRIVDLAMKLMEEAAQEHENVLQDPAPFVVFEEFGDNSLSLTLRAHLSSVEYLLTTKSELHGGIRSKLEAAGITIAFPQREVHLDASKPLEIRMLHPNKPLPE
jgi:potassium efflux system protein